MADDAARLDRLSAADHRSALGSYNRTQEIALAVLLVLDVAAAALVVALLAERRRTGQMLDASTERYRTLVEQLPAATFIMDATGTPTYVSPQIEGILGRSPEQLRTDGATPEGRLPWFHPDDADQMRRHVAPVYHGAADGYDFRARMLRHDGSVRHLHAIASARRAADGTLTAVQGILMDVTGEVLAQEQADADRRRYQALVEQIPVITYITTPAGEITYVSPQIERILGYGEADYGEPGSIEQRLPELLDPAAVDHVAERMAALFAGDVDDVDVTTQMLARDGETRHVQIIARAVRDGNGRVTDTQGVVVDQTALHLAEERRTEALRALITAGEDVQRRIAGELHDDTIQVVTAVVIQLRRHARRLPELEETAGILAAALERTRRLMFELRPEVLERDGLGAALRAVAGDGPWQEAVVDVQVPRQVAATEALVYRAVRELVVNARKHSRAAHLAIDGRADERLLHFEVSDDGVGFDPDEATDRERMARHIGLHSTIERIRLAGGEVTIDAAPGRGATFRLAVPADPRDG